MIYMKKRSMATIVHLLVFMSLVSSSTLQCTPGCTLCDPEHPENYISCDGDGSTQVIRQCASPLHCRTTGTCGVVCDWHSGNGIPTTPASRAVGPTTTEPPKGKKCHKQGCSKCIKDTPGNYNICVGKFYLPMQCPSGTVCKKLSKCKVSCEFENHDAKTTTTTTTTTPKPTTTTSTTSATTTTEPSTSTTSATTTEPITSRPTTSATTTTEPSTSTTSATTTEPITSRPTTSATTTTEPTTSTTSATTTTSTTRARTTEPITSRPTTNATTTIEAIIAHETPTTAAPTTTTITTTTTTPSTTLRASTTTVATTEKPKVTKSIKCRSHGCVICDKVDRNIYYVCQGTTPTPSTCPPGTICKKSKRCEMNCIYKEQPTTTPVTTPETTTVRTTTTTTATTTTAHSTTTSGSGNIATGVKCRSHGCVLCDKEESNKYHVCVGPTPQPRYCSTGTVCHKTSHCQIECEYSGHTYTTLQSTTRSNTTGPTSPATTTIHYDDCLLPRCFDTKPGIPGGLDRADTPMLVFLSYDDGITAEYFHQYRQIFFNLTNQRTNPNGCPYTATHFLSHKWTHYDYVQQLYDAGHEIASHSINHLKLSGTSKEFQRAEMAGQRDKTVQLTTVPREEIRGARMPYLELGGDRLYDMLEQEGFLYDSSIPYLNIHPLWPHTMHSKLGYCDRASQDCPRNPHNLWQVPINAFLSPAETCALLDGCRPATESDAYDLIWSNFLRHYNADDKPPFGINMHAALFIGWPYTMDAMKRFLDTLQTLDDVWVVPIYDVIQWIKDPTPISDLDNFAPFMC